MAHVVCLHGELSLQQQQGQVAARWSCCLAQVDYASAALFLNISAHISGSAESQVAWWQHPELRMKAGLDPRTQARNLPSSASPPCMYYDDLCQMYMPSAALSSIIAAGAAH